MQKRPTCPPGAIFKRFSWLTFISVMPETKIWHQKHSVYFNTRIKGTTLTQLVGVVYEI